MSQTKSGHLKAPLALGALLGGALLAGCASTAPAATGAAKAQWLKLEQVEQRFAIFTSAPPVPAEGGFATFRLVYVYMPETVQHEGKYVGWQEYSAMTVNCPEDTVRVGPRTRYAPDGTIMMSDDSQDFAPIMGPAIRRAASIVCDGEALPDPVLIDDGEGWVDAARQNIAATTP